MHRLLNRGVLIFTLAFLASCDGELPIGEATQTLEELRSSKEISPDPESKESEDPTDTSNTDSSNSDTSGNTDTSGDTGSSDPVDTFDPEPVFKGFVVTSGYIPLSDAEVYIAGELSSKTAVDKYGKFRISTSSSDPIDLVIIHYELGISKHFKGLAVPTAESGAIDLGMIELQESNVIRGKLNLNTEVGSYTPTGSKKPLLDINSYFVEVLSQDTGKVSYKSNVNRNGEYIIDGVSDGIWDLRITDETDPANIKSILMENITTTGGLVTSVLKGSAVKYDDAQFAAVMTAIDTSAKTVTISDLSQTNTFDQANVEYFDAGGNSLGTEAIAYAKDLTLTPPANTTAIKINYEYTDGASVTHYTPNFYFEVSFADADSDGAIDLLDCDPADASKMIDWYKMVKDSDGDGYYTLPLTGACGGLTVSSFYKRSKLLNGKDCDDGDASKRYLRGFANLTLGQPHKYFCTGPGLDVPSGYGEEITGASSMNFINSTSKPDIITIQAYNVSDNVDDLGAGQIIVPALTKDTYIYLGTYDPSIWKIITVPGETKLLGVYTTTYDMAARIAPTIEDTNGSPVVVDTDVTGLSTYRVDDFVIGNFYNKSNIITSGNPYSDALLGLSEELNGEVIFYLGSYSIRAEIDLSNLLNSN